MTDTPTGPDELVHQTLRLKILSALRTEPEGSMLEFVRLKKITGATDGNLGRHINTLADAGYVTMHKDFHRNRPRTRVELTRTGRDAFDAHIDYLKSLIGDL